MFTELTQTADGFLELGVPGYDCAVYHKGECVYRHWNGYSDKATQTPMNGTELYNIYSCSKVITCTAALMLHERGMLALEDKLSEYLPEFKEMTVKAENGIKKAKNDITIKHLFTMTAGFSYDLNSPQLIKCREETGGRCPTREVMKYLAKEPLLFEPGEKWEYSLCHDVLAAVVEVVSGMKFGEFVKENIFKPLKMVNSTFLLDDSELSRVCTHYRLDADTNTVVERSKITDFKLGSEYESGGAGCISTVEDYIKFLEALRTGKLVKPETIKLMRTDYLTDKQRESYWVRDYGYGLGVRCPRNGDDNVTDFGWGGAAGAFLAIDEKNEFTLFYAQHVLYLPEPLLRYKLTEAVRKALCG